MSDLPKLTAASCRAARALLNWTAKDLVREANVSPNTVTKLENGEPVTDSTRAKLEAAFAAAGVEVLNGDAPGARLRTALRGAT